MERVVRYLVFILALSFTVVHAGFFDFLNFEDALVPTVSLGLIGAVISSVLIAVAYMLGSALNMPNLTGWAKEQLGTLVTGALILVVVVMIILSLGPIARLITGNESITTFFDYRDAALDTIDNMMSYVKGRVPPLVEGYYILSKYTTFSRSTTYSALKYIVYFTSKAPNAGLSPLQMTISNAINWLMRSMVWLASLKAVIKAIFSLGLLLLITGIMLRFIPFTVKLGNTLIAFMLGMILMFPMSILIGGKVWEAAQPPPTHLNIPDPGTPPLFSVVCSPVIGTFFGTTEYGWWLVICTPVCTGLCVASGPAFPSCFWDCWRPGVDDIVEGGFCFEMVETWYYYILITWQLTYSAILSSWGNLSQAQVDQITETVYHDGFYPAVYTLVTIALITFYSIILTIGAIRSISIALGGEVYFYGLAKII